MALAAKIIVVSDSVAAGTASDRSGPRIATVLESAGFAVIDHKVVSDGTLEVAAALRASTTEFAGLIVTIGGTGFGPRDLTPEATDLVVERRAPGLAEAMRAVSPLGRLGRGIAGAIGSCLICNLPGSPNGAAEQLGAVLDVLPHALELLVGKAPHPQTVGLEDSREFDRGDRLTT